jgi:hypothetical protein
MKKLPISAIALAAAISQASFARVTARFRTACHHKRWNYTVRLYRPRAEILGGKWKFPEPQPAS